VARLLRWAGLAAATAITALLLEAIGIPSPSLFGALLVGLLAALLVRGLPQVPLSAFRAAQAITGASLGVYVQSSSLNALTSVWLSVALVSAGTLVLSLLAGNLLSRATGVDRPTAALGMIAGGRRGSSAWRASSAPTTGSWRSCSTCAC
jgi:uncharacterized membrane protein AbrB (regulator of aidB expression)